MENKEMTRREFLRKTGQAGLTAAAGLTLAGCQTAAPKQKTTPMVELYMPNGTRQYFALTGNPETAFAALTPSGRVGTLGLGAISNGVDPVRMDVDMNQDVQYKIGGTAHAPVLMMSYETPRDNDNTSFPMVTQANSLEALLNGAPLPSARPSSSDGVDTTNSLGTLYLENGDLQDRIDLVVPVNYLPLQKGLVTEESYLRDLANELAENYGQMTQDGRLVERTPSQVLGDLRNLLDYDTQIISSWARPATERDELIVRGMSGDNSLSYGFVAHGMSPLAATESKLRMNQGLTNGYFNQTQYNGSQ